MKTLIIYGTRYGTAKEIAEKITDILREKDVEVDLVNSKDKKDFDLTSYDLVVVGSGIKIGKWTKNALNFLKKNKAELANKRVAIFVTCGAANIEKTAAEGQEKYLDNVANKYLINKPVSTGLFGGVYDPDANHGMLFKMVKRSIKKDMIKQGQDPNKRQDYRDWDAIKKWTLNLLNQ